VFVFLLGETFSFSLVWLFNLDLPFPNLLILRVQLDPLDIILVFSYDC